MAVVALVISAALFDNCGNKYLYGFDVTADYHYDFLRDNNSLSRIPCKIYQDHFVLPNQRGAWDTGLLKIDLHATLLGKWLSPYVEITCAGKHYKQFFEYGAGGIRYLNISHLAGKASGTVTLTGHHLSWGLQDGQLLLFRNPDPAGKKILFLSPHPDDAEIAGFGFYSFKDSYIVTVTDGSTGAEKYQKYFYGTDMPTSLGLIAKLRVLDSVTVPQIGGVPAERCYNLGYFAETLKAMHDHPDRETKNLYTNASSVNCFRDLNRTRLSGVGTPKWSSLVNDLSTLLKEIQPDIIVTPDPALDTNLDHEYSSLALFEAIGKTGSLKEGKLYLYSNHYILGRSSQYGEQGSLASLPPLFSPTKKFRSVYSYELKKETQVEKVFALDAMHDLRPLPYAVHKSPLDAVRDLAHSLVGYTRNGSEFDLSYYRKSVKANEFFFVYSYGDIPELTAGFQQYQRDATARVHGFTGRP